MVEITRLVLDAVEGLETLSFLLEDSSFIGPLSLDCSGTWTLFFLLPLMGGTIQIPSHSYQ